jgi:hypothetical protein
MSRDDAKAERLLYDIRIIERNIKKGLVNRKDYHEYLKTLPDAADKIAPSSDLVDDDDLDEDLDEPTGPNGVG